MGEVAWIEPHPSRSARTAEDTDLLSRQAKLWPEDKKGALMKP